MPKEITHMLLADEIAGAAAKTPGITALVKKYSHEYYFGSVGPDFLYYDIALPFDNKKNPRGIPWADTIHGAEAEDTMAHLAAVLRILRDEKLNHRITANGQPLSVNEKEMLLAFALGYLTHAGLDMELHPVVYYYSGNYYDKHPEAQKDSVTRHRVIETVLDLYVLKFYQKRFMRYRIAKLMKVKKKNLQLIMALFTLALRLAYGRKTKPLEEGYSEIEISDSIRKDPLYKTCLRSYKKHRWLAAGFQNRFLARFVIWLNRQTNNKLSEYSSLCYPARSYDQYLKRGFAFQIEDIKDYTHPFTGKSQPLILENKFKRIIGRSRRMLNAYYSAYSGIITIKEMRNVITGASLNNGKLDAPVRKMVHYKPLDVTGSFRAS